MVPQFFPCSAQVVGMQDASRVRTRAGRLDGASLEEKSVPSDESPAMLKLKVPLPWTTEVTSYSTQVPMLTEPRLPRAEPTRAGLLFQVMPLSVQVFEVE